MYLKKLIPLLGVLLALAVIACGISVWTAGELVIPLEQEYEGIAVRNTAPEVVEVTVSGADIHVRPLARGEAVLELGDPESPALLVLRSLRGGVIFCENDGSFSGWQPVQLILLGFALLAFGCSLWAMVLQLKRELYSYASPLAIAVCLLLGSMLAVQLLVLSLFGLTAQTISSAVYVAQYMLWITFLLMALFFAAMLVSNLSLLRHEGKTWRNLLGAIIGLAFCAATMALHAIGDFSGSELQVRLFDMAMNVVSLVVLWAEYKLLGIILCGWLANRREPAPEMDYVLILGCRLSRKGGLTPLLRGRVDRALAFREKQTKATGKVPVLVPCGGQGKDELTSEAAAMRAYLLEKGIPDEEILPEDRSANTWENMKNAQRMIAERTPNAKVAFSTTNYHVFRSGLWARRNGFPVEGMGSRTKWYYWPNAFMREYIALLKAGWKHELAALLLGIAVIAVATLLKP